MHYPKIKYSEYNNIRQPYGNKHCIFVKKEMYNK